MACPKAARKKSGLLFRLSALAPHRSDAADPQDSIIVAAVHRARGFLAVFASPAEQNTHHSTRQRPASILTHARGSSGVNRTVPQWTLPWLFWNVPVSVPLFP